MVMPIRCLVLLMHLFFPNEDNSLSESDETDVSFGVPLEVTEEATDEHSAERTSIDQPT